MSQSASETHHIAHSMKRQVRDGTTCSTQLKKLRRDHCAIHLHNNCSCLRLALYFKGDQENAEETTEKNGEERKRRRRMQRTRRKRPGETQKRNQTRIQVTRITNMQTQRKRRREHRETLRGTRKKI